MQQLKTKWARRGMWMILFLTLASGLANSSVRAQTSDFIYGADLSFVPWQRANGAVWSGFGHEGQPVQQFRDSGWSVVRLRLWHTPDSTTWKTWHNLDSTLSFAHEVVDAGMGWMLDFHYSDTWADPGKQYVPAAWEGLDLETLADSLYNYTVDVISRCRREGILPAYVQIGNEINNGILWPVGKLYGTGDDAQAWSNYATLLQAARQGVIDGAAPLDRPVIVLHSSNGGSASGSQWWLNNCLGRGVVPDLVGFSFYPWWHGTFDDLSENLNFVAEEYDLPVMVVEASYPWTLGNADSQGNIVGSSDQLLDGYPADPYIQLNYFRDLADVVKSVPDGMGRGLMLWEPAWISVPTATSGGENLAVFNFEGDALPGILAPEQTTGTSEGVSFTPISSSLGIPYPTPTNGFVTVNVDLAGNGKAKMDLFAVTGRHVGSVPLPKSAGHHRIGISLGVEASGVYLVRFSDGQGNTETRRIILVR